MSVRQTYSVTLRQALAMVGDRNALAVRLRVSASDLTSWLDGVAEPPRHIFLKAVDIVMEEEPTLDPPHRRRSSRGDGGVTGGK
jgi:hypothetical protein